MAAKKRFQERIPPVAIQNANRAIAIAATLFTAGMLLYSVQPWNRELIRWTTLIIVPLVAAPYWYLDWIGRKKIPARPTAPDRPRRQRRRCHRWRLLLHRRLPPHRQHTYSGLLFIVVPMLQAILCIAVTILLALTDKKMNWKK